MYGNSLTQKQAKVLAFIEKEITRTGRPPTYRDIAEHCGYEAVGTVQDHVRALIKKGYLTKEDGVARGFRLAYQSESVSVPILGTVPAGRPIEAIEDTQGSLAVSSKSARGDVFALKVRGESMIEAGILEGDYVIVRKQNEAENGEIIVALLDGEATVKYLEKKAGRVRLLPANPRFEPIDVVGSTSSIVQGKVIGVQRFY